MKKNKILIIFTTTLAFFMGAIGMYLVFYYFPVGSSKSVVNKLEKEVTVTDAGIADAVEKIYDAVVIVESYQNDSLIATGTGFIYKISDEKGYILTNNHVIDGANKVKVIFTNEKEIETTVVGKDTYSDIAVLSVPSTDVIKVVKLGESKDLRVGDTVFTVGAPLDSTYSWTVTRGILSGKDRMVEVAMNNTSSTDYIMKVLQTDAAINSGNSGGPLANSNGEVVGITSLKLISSGVEGMGFAIPIEDAVIYATKLESGESIARPYLGVSMYDSNYTQFTDVSKEGVTIYEVESDSSAEKSGLKKGDIITTIDSVKVISVAEFKYNLYKHEVGETIKLTILRDGTEKVISIKLKANNQ